MEKIILQNLILKSFLRKNIFRPTWDMKWIIKKLFTQRDRQQFLQVAKNYGKR